MIDAIVAMGIIIISLVALFVGLTLGFASSGLGNVGVLGIGLLMGSVLWISTLLFSSSLGVIPFFLDLATMVHSLPFGGVVLGNSALTTVLLLIVILELGYFSGYGSGRLRLHENNVPPSKVATAPVAPIASRAAPMVNLSSQEAAFFQAPPRQFQKNNVPSGPLSEDEKTIAALLLQNSIRSINPKINDSPAVGYFYEELKGLNWRADRESSALSSLASRGYLMATVKEKILHCKQCNSTDLQYTTACPECGCLNLSKHRVLEHFACGNVDREEKFRAPNGDLVCPKCNKRLEALGIDYRSLGSMYVCQNCGALNRELSHTLKCRKCGFAATPDQEKEQYLYGYTINDQMFSGLRMLLEPTNVASRYVRSAGYSVFSPASVRGKSGREYTFDMLVIAYGRRGQNGERSDSKRFAVDILTSLNPIQTGDLRDLDSKAGDLSFRSVVIAIPGVSSEARASLRSDNLDIIESANTNEIVPKLEAYLALSWTTVSTSEQPSIPRR